jgi:hypothetical protein
MDYRQIISTSLVKPYINPEFTLQDEYNGGICQPVFKEYLPKIEKFPQLPGENSHSKTQSNPWLHAEYAQTI